METSEPQAGAETPNDRPRHEVGRDQLPLHCPLPGTSGWNSHPRVYLPLKAQGKATCPYCGAEYVLRD